MASNPSFQVEDQTDEDFFNKLVDDEFEGTALGPKFSEGSDSDETKAFANLSIGDAGAAFDDSGVKGGLEPKATAINCPVDGDSLGAHVEESNSLVQSSSFGVNSGNESNDCVTKLEDVSNPPMSNTGGSRGSGVKEVQWSAFNTDSAPSGSSNYPDLFNDLGESSGDFPGEMVENLSSEAKTVSVNGEYKTEDLGYSVNYGQYAVSQVNGMTGEQSVIGQDLSSSQYWESLNPGWKYDPNSGQLYQVDDNAAVGSVVSDEKPEVSYLQQTARSVAGTVIESGTTASVSSWNQSSQANNGYPEHMIFDPQHPDWYYDTNAQEWRSLASYIAWGQTSVQTYDQHYQNEFPSTGASSCKSDSGVYNNYGQADNYGSKGQDSSWSGSFTNYNHSNENGFTFTDPSHSNDSEVHGQYGQSDSHGSQVFDGQVQDNKRGGSSNLNQQGPNMWQAETDAKSELASYFRGNQQLENMYVSANSINNPVFKQMSYNSTGTVPMYEKASQGHNSTNEVGLRTSVPIGNFNQQLNGAIEQNEQMHSLNDHKSSQKSLSFSEQSFCGGHQFPHAPSMGRSSAGRPPHALVAFGFGGKLIIMKDCNTLGNSSFGNQEPAGCSISFLSLMEVVTEKTDALSVEVGASDYFHSLCQKSVPGPLVGGNVGSKELNKWIDERIANCESSYMNSRKGEVWRLLLSLLRIACQYYGKLRSPFGADTLLRENDIPETAVAKLFASAKNGAQGSQYGALTNCLQSLPSEGQLRAIASDVQNLVVSGRKKEALHSAQEGQLWGPALVLASQLGDQFYVDTVKKMALHQLVPGSPLRTLCLLIAGQPADVFSTDTTAESGFLAGVNMSAPSAQFGANSMLDDWEENLAVITANRTKDDELVLIHLGDCLWRERSEITAAHICYLVAEANFESYSDSARLCLIGADHWKFPRTYASPEAIQRTELYEYSKVLGNSQFILLPFQPYKLLYAHMLAEVGKVSDSQKYCQAVLKSLKAGQTPEVEMLKQLASSLEERIRNHQQGGYASNFVSGQFGKFLSFIDNTAHRVVGGLPPPVPSAAQGSAQGNEHYYQQVGPRVSTSQSTLAMSSLMPSASMEPVSEWKADGSRMTMHNRSVSEPDIGRTPRQDQVDWSTKAASSDAKGKTSVSGGLSRFSPFGFGSQILQKSLGLVLKSRQDRQAKLGESNKFYYDEKLKRWVEEGAEPPAEEAALPPPPTTASFPNEISDFGLSNASRSEGLSTNGSPDSKSPPTSEGISGMPPVPPSSNQFSARGRMGVRSRYVDTFNQGGGIPANLFQSPSVPSAKPVVAANAKFFIPTPASSGEQAVDTFTESVQEAATSNEVPSTSSTNDLFQSPGPSSSTRMQKFPSMNNIPNNKVMTNLDRSNPSISRRTASWCGSSNDAFCPSKVAEVKPLGEALGRSPSSFMSSDPVMRQSSLNGGSFAEDLHEVEL